MTTTNERIREQYEAERALNEHGSEDHLLDLVPKVDADPADADNGDLWYNTTADEYRGVEGGAIVSFNTTAV